MNAIVPVINRVGVSGALFDELTGPDVNSIYSFQTAEKHFGSATFRFQFKDPSGAVIDPLQTQTSSTTIKTVEVTATGQSSRFTYSESLVITMEVAGDSESEKRVTGSATFNGLGYSLTYTFPAPGLVTTFRGFTSGLVTASGTGLGLPTSASLAYSSDHSADGTIVWEGDQGGIHIKDNGEIAIVTKNSRILIE